MSDRYNQPERGTQNWDVLLNENFREIGTDVDELEGDLSVLEGDVQTLGGDVQTLESDVQTLENDVEEIGSGSGGGSGGGSDVDATSVEGIDHRRQHVGPLHQGAYHSGGADADNTSGIVFEAEDLHIESCVVDAEAAGTETFELREYNGSASDPPIVDSTTVSLDAGPQRIPLGFDVPASGNGDPNDEYVLARGPTTNPVSLRRVGETDGGATLFEQYTYTDPQIDFLRGTATMDDGDFGAEAYYYYFFDLLVGDLADRTDAPWSTDVDEIYMRPRPPEEEFDDVSPRAIWINTSQ